MTSPKYDLNNYVKHQAIPIIQNNHKINKSFGSYLLMVKWWSVNIDKILPKPDLIGKLRIHLTTPFGDLEPQEYRLKVSDSKKVYAQFLSMPQPDFNYRIEVIHPQGITRSHLEIWEYIPPQIFTNSVATMPIYGQDDTATNALIAATTANTAAVMAMAATNPSADAIADAIQNNSVVTLPASVITVGTALVSLLTKSLLTQKVTIKNLSNQKVKIWIGDTAPTIPAGLPGAGSAILFTTPGETVEIAAGNGVYEVPDALCKSGIYGICNTSSGSVSVTRTYTN